jgi:hypothetical protein
MLVGVEPVSLDTLLSLGISVSLSASSLLNSPDIVISS